MAVSDVYSLHVHMQMPAGPASLNFHYQETTPPSSLDGTDALSEGWLDTNGPLLRAILSNECKLTQVVVFGKGTPRKAPGYASLVVGTGLSGASPLPAQFGAKLALGQTFFEPRSNGMVWIPGLDEERVTVSLIDAEYLNGAIKDFADSLLLEVEEPSVGDGRFRLGVVSQKFLEANPGDWVGAFADVTGISRLPLVGRQRRRRTKIRGGAA